MVLLLVSLWLVVEAYEKEPKRECECCSILRAFGAAAAQIEFYVVSSPFTIAKSIGMSTILGFIAAPLAVGAAVRGFACLGQALKCDC